MSTPTGRRCSCNRHPGHDPVKHPWPACVRHGTGAKPAAPRPAVAAATKTNGHARPPVQPNRSLQTLTEALGGFVAESQASVARLLQDQQAAITTLQAKAAEAVKQNKAFQLEHIRLRKNIDKLQELLAGSRAAADHEPELEVAT